ncbi:MAG: Cation transporting ATPase (E1-E2 family) protein [Parcubacteria group bacterium GW2011_GWC1_42_11]|uniref:Cation transporting ATPase (E1-E2 family) protein n=1 Tax=Candidatus Nomurabacteria bacterium GW2011_GWC2_42_20 TaxID=1618756 RepID=A0A0G0ZHY3_9BACT|nr:MAG: Cation transporting ATPase (E1-E2 family) protein [Parcubacteria group bacterium GW2011_GWC1_42_11]KKS48357.1 MAG: Cation transporting ATPase (E1-E2 family) protein [Candidatus Nomurabacteria bacterium GW2011_GWC2_42_20]KKS59025.1 MAG: Cation transporting ATPase (E1-E2 family) protein [Candidatus Nomurabacteria bacterium GW2011_GWA2_42_41]KKT09933.1 MAG: Cation transporting ATPase (E1-E2 family) protein [Candidatus Nomurabacteria bacterium GW2011_GWB1_43_20]
MKETLYTCPMHSNIVRTEPGMCPECGMSLVPARAWKDADDTRTVAEGNPHSPDSIPHKHASSPHSSAFTKHEGHHTAEFLKKFWIVLALTIPILVYSEIFARAFTWTPPQFIGVQYAILALGSTVFFYGGLVFLLGAYRELRAGLPGMMTLIALAITAAYSFSIFSVLTGSEHTLFWELSTLIAVMLLGHWIEMKAVQGAQGALKELAKLLPDTAEVLRDGSTETVSISELRVGDRVLVRPGAKVPADGVVVEGRSELDESIITGESKLISKEIDSEVIAGSINGDGSLTIEVKKIGEGTFLAGVMRLVADAQASKSRLQILSDRAALYLTVIAVVAGTATFIAWIFANAGVVFATERLVAVLVITCPHALGLAVPLVASISTTMAARNGFLVRQRIALESARAIDIVLFDKTGTLTQGAFGVHAIIPTGSFNDIDVLKKGAELDQGSEHPLAKAIVVEARRRGVVLESMNNFERVAGKGARGDVGGETVLIGNESFMNEVAIVVAEEFLLKTRALESEGKTVIFVASQGHLVGAIALADIIRQESREAIQSLRKLGIRTAMITGDSPDTAKWVARELGIDEYFARVLPGEKSEKVKILQAQGHKVAMVGDGVNDAPALTQADLGIAIGAGTNVAIESAGIILVRNDPRDIPKIIRLSQLTYTKMIQNLFWATGYNLIALPLAAGVLAYKGVILQPAVAAVFMSASTVIVAINALLLRRNNLSTI